MPLSHSQLAKWVCGNITSELPAVAVLPFPLLVGRSAVLQLPKGVEQEQLLAELRCAGGE